MIRFTIPGNPATKKNSMRIAINHATGHPLILPSKRYIEFEKASAPFLPKTRIDYPVNIKCTYYMQTRRKVDLTNLLSATCDILVKYSVVVDDNRDIVASHDGSKVLYCKESPRTEIEITRLEDYKKWGK